MSIVYIILCYTPDKQLLTKNMILLRNKQVVVVNNNPNFFLRDVHETACIRLLNTGKNLGYAGGMNLGMKYAWNMNAEWVVLLNDDVALTKQGLDNLETQLHRCDPGIYGPEIGWLDKKRWTTLLKNTRNSNLRIDTLDSCYVSGSVMCIHKRVDMAVKGFYEPYFMYYEDVDYCVRAKHAGFPVEELTVPFTHKFKSINRDSYFHQYYLARNHLLFVFRFAPLLVRIHEVLRLPKTLFEHWKARQRGALNGSISGVACAILLSLRLLR